MQRTRRQHRISVDLIIGLQLLVDINSIITVFLALAGRVAFSVYVSVKRVCSSNRRCNMIADFFIYLFTDEEPAGHINHEDTIQNGNELPHLT